jgi:hypothetical protein
MSSWLWKGNRTFITAPFICKEWKVGPGARKGMQPCLERIDKRIVVSYFEEAMAGCVNGVVQKPAVFCLRLGIHFGGCGW